MFLHRNERIIWRNGSRMITMKFFIVGEVKRVDGKSFFISQSVFWDSSRYPDPTKRILVGVRFTFYGIDPDELTNYEVKVSTNNGSPVDYYQEFKHNDCIVLEYRSYYPLVVKVHDYPLNKRYEFVAQWNRKPHESQLNDFIFVLYVKSHSEPLGKD